jgi:alkylation response protein AidB-like acyl-CoA dehydrogenase
VTRLESVTDFADRAAHWLAAGHLPRSVERSAAGRPGSDERELDRIAVCRRQQRRLYDAGLAGICVPREYGGLGLTTAHQDVFNDLIAGYDYPAEIQVPTFTPCLAVILDFGTEEQKRRHIPPMLRGEQLWMQFLSEPSGGSDVAAARLAAVRDGTDWVLNGSKVWTTGAWWADWALCLARSNPDVGKHDGLTVFMLPIRQPGIAVHRIEMVNGSREFCQEFLTDVRVPDTDRLGDIDDGWTVGRRWMHHERTTNGGSPYVTRPAGLVRTLYGPPGGAAGLARRAVAAGFPDPETRSELVGEARALELVGRALTSHVARAIADGSLPEAAAAITKLFAGLSTARSIQLGYELAGAAAAAWDDQDVEPAGVTFLMRQAMCIGGGTTEMNRQIVAERVLGMPRTTTADRGVPFRDIPHGPPSR